MKPAFRAISKQKRPWSCGGQSGPATRSANCTGCGRQSEWEDRSAVEGLPFFNALQALVSPNSCERTVLLRAKIAEVGTVSRGFRIEPISHEFGMVNEVNELLTQIGDLTEHWLLRNRWNRPQTTCGISVGTAGVLAASSISILGRFAIQATFPLAG